MSRSLRATKSSCGVLVDEGFKDGSELLLVAARELRGGFEYLLHLAGRARPALLPIVSSYQIFH
jgi:hypothetical protein